MAKNMNFLDMASWILCTIAALHLGLVGAFGYDVFGKILGAGSTANRIVYVVIGLLGLYSLGHMLTCSKK